jgi:hypothetical protein
MKNQPLTLATYFFTSLALVGAPKWTDPNNPAEAGAPSAEEPGTILIPAKQPVRASQTRWKVEVKDAPEKNEMQTIENADGTTTIQLSPEINVGEEPAPASDNAAEAVAAPQVEASTYVPQPQMLRNGKPITLTPPTEVPAAKGQAVLQPLDENEAAAAPSGIIRNGKSVEMPTRGSREVKVEDTIDTPPPLAQAQVEPTTPPPAIQRNGQEVNLTDAPIQRNGKADAPSAPSLFRRNGKDVNLEPAADATEKPVLKRQAAPSLFGKTRSKNDPKMVIEPIIPERRTDEVLEAAEAAAVNSPLPAVNPLESNPLLPPIDPTAAPAGATPASGTNGADLDALASALGGASASSSTPPAANSAGTGDSTEKSDKPTSFIVNGEEAYAAAVANDYYFMPRGCINRPDGRGSVAQILPGTNSSMVNGVTMRQMQTLPGWGNISRNTFYLFSSKRGGPKPLAEGWTMKSVEITGSNWNWVAKPQEGARSAYLAIQLTGRRGGNEDTIASVSRLQLIGPPGAKDWKEAFKPAKP